MSSTGGSGHRSSIGDLAAFSAGIGADRCVIQGPGGNTSIKQDGVLWIKASGTWLADALNQDIFVPVALQPLQRAIDRNDPSCETCQEYIVEALNPRRLRPSIETTVHAVLPQKIVVHVHCVDTIAWAVQEDAEAKLAPLLSGFDWQFVPYIRPGMPLSRRIVERLQPATAILVLGNHGLVVAAESVAEVSQLLSEVRHRLHRPAREAPPVDYAALSRLAQETAYFVPDDPQIHAVATDPIRLHIARRGSLYPDHVIFLGRSIRIASTDSVVALTHDMPSPVLAIEETGVLLAKAISPSALAMARCICDVTARLQCCEPIHFLSAEDEAKLLNWDAEKYRQALAGVQR